MRDWSKKYEEKQAVKEREDNTLVNQALTHWTELTYFGVIWTHHKVPKQFSKREQGHVWLKPIDRRF